MRRPKLSLTRVELIAAINRLPVSPEIDRSSREFVEAWIRNPDLMRPIEQSYQSNANALKSLRAALSAGKLTDAIRNRAIRSWSKGSYRPRPLPGLWWTSELEIGIWTV
jgi:hypothetical protein